MANLFEYLAKQPPSEMERLVGWTASRLHIPRQWLDDMRQEVYLAWLAKEYDPSYAHDAIMKYAGEAAFLAVSTWRRHTILPVTVHKAGQADSEPRAEQYELLAEKIPDLVDELHEEDDAEPEVFLEADSTASAHLIDLPKRSPRSALTHENLLALHCEGLSAAEIAAAANISERSVYRRLERLKKWKT
jgi:DNA-directed RNA polymerase specialized sigma24 family protein